MKGGNIMAKKNYVLDTNILIHDPDCIYKFEDNDIYIPAQVIEELDKFKTERTERGYAARTATKNIASFINKGDLTKGVPLEDGGKLYICYNIAESAFEKLPVGFQKDKMDNLILLTVKNLQANKRARTILVTNDTNMQIKAQIMGIQSQEYKNDRIAADVEIYSGRSVRYVTDAFFDDFFTFVNNDIDVYPTAEMKDLTTNEFINLRTWEGRSILTRFDGKTIKKLENIERKPNPCGLKARNMGQWFMGEALLSNKPLTIIKAPAGTGKTLWSIGCGLHQVMEEGKYKKVLVCRANVTMDEDIGFLPGSEMDKIDPLLRGVYDNIEVLFTNPDDTPEEAASKKDYLFSRGYLQAQSLAYLRGRSISNTYIIIDEAQNCSGSQMDTIIKRAGEGTKIVLIGDTDQIDNPRLDGRNNGLVYAIEKMKGSELCEIVSMDESECTRSALAKEAAKRLKR